MEVIDKKEYISKIEVVRILQKAYAEGRIKAKDGLASVLDDVNAADVQPIDKDNMHIIYIGRKAYLAENTIMEFMLKMDIIRDAIPHIENYFDTYAEAIQQINACMGRFTDITEVKYFIDRIKENSGYD